MRNRTSGGMEWQHLPGSLIPLLINRLAEVLKNPDWRVRMGAELALPAIPGEKSVQFVRAVGNDKNGYVRRIAQAVIKKHEE